MRLTISDGVRELQLVQEGYGVKAVTTRPKDVGDPEVHLSFEDVRKMISWLQAYEFEYLRDELCQQKVSF